MINNETRQIIEFMYIIEKFKTLKRRCHKSNNESETNSDHTWHLCMFIFSLKNILKEKNLDLDKCLKLALIHDLPEILTGDELPFKTNLKTKKKKKK